MIGEALAFCPTDHQHSAFLIIVAKRDAVIESEFEFSEIAMQVLLAGNAGKCRAFRA